MTPSDKAALLRVIADAVEAAINGPSNYIIGGLFVEELRALAAALDRVPLDDAGLVVNSVRTGATAAAAKPAALEAAVESEEAAITPSRSAEIHVSRLRLWAEAFRRKNEPHYSRSLLAAELEASAAELERLTHALADAEAKLADITTERDEIKAERDSAVATACAEWRERALNAERERNEARQELDQSTEDYRAALRQNDTARRAAESALATVTAERDDLQRQFSAQRAGPWVWHTIGESEHLVMARTRDHIVAVTAERDRLRSALDGGKEGGR